VVLPSASTLIAIRSAQNHKGSPDKLVAIIADPVFSSSDDRVPQEASRPAVAKAAADQNPDQAEQQTVKKLRLARLAHASEEADAISTAAPWGTTLVAKGFDASREKVMSSEVSRAQIVHFATHGFLDTEHPELSALVLTMTDRNGAKTDGLMPLPDIYTLDLSAQLIVLSACQTALGKDIKGEGLVGLTHSFMSAGAKSVVASLWKVDDRATAALMADFYKGMLQEDMTPAAALRAAKLKMMKEKQWSAPYYWAGFVLQGEYTNRIAADRYSWLRPGLVLLILLILIAAALLVFQTRRRRIRPA
jgi:CHAT domain-containing protein